MSRSKTRKHPFLAVDVVVLSKEGEILLVKRKRIPIKGTGHCLEDL